MGHVNVVITRSEKKVESYEKKNKQVESYEKNSELVESSGEKKLEDKESLPTSQK